MDRLGGDVRAQLGRLGLPEAGDLAAITAAWPEVVGETVARHSWPSRLGDDGTLHVATTSSTWAFELGRLAPDLLARFRERLGSTAPGSLRFAPGPVPAPDSPAPEERPHAVDVTAADRAEAAPLVAGAGDESLRELLSRAAAAALARARSDRRF
jgi:hypothetical protein